MSGIEQWLQRLGLDRYAPAFAENEVDLADLPELTEADLAGLGLPLGPRRRILKALREEAGDGPAAPQAAAPDRSPASERRQLTIMFCDLVGSTALSARLDPEDYRDAIRAYQDACAGVIARYDGFVAKFMGDGVLAYFGWPHGHENDAERAVSAALGVVEAAPQIALPPGEDPLAVRIGVATGTVVVGDIVGQGAAQEAAVTGETPNLAARLQEAAGANAIVISETTRNLAGGFFGYAPLGELTLKGIPAPAAAYRVLGRREVESRYEAQRAEVLPLVGREQELALVRERWARARAGEGQGVLLVGEAGIGKSRIVRGLIDSLAGEPHLRVQYQCSPFHGGSAFWPVIQQLRHAARIAPREPAADQREKLARLLAEGGATPEDATLLAALIGAGDAAEPPGLTPEERRARTMDALVRQMTGLAARRPVLMVLEDAHWIDPTTLEMLERCLDAIADAPVLMLLTGRPDNQPELAGHPHVTRLTLNRLGREGLAEIVARLGGDALPPETVAAIIDRTDGVPLFVEELTKAVLETGETTIPASLHDSLMSRLDRFPDVKEVAQIAACIGREFDFDLLMEIAGRPERELTLALERLIAAELVFRRGAAGAGGFIFKHALVRDAAHESLLKRRRQEVHRRLVDALERREGAAPEAIARHAEAAGMVEKAVELWTQAGDQAVARPAYKEAIAAYGAAIALCRAIGADPAQRRAELDIQVKLGQALIAHLGYQAPATMATFERAVELAEDLDDDALIVPAIYGLWASRYIAGRPSAALARRMADRVAGRGDDGEACVSRRMLALEAFHRAKYRDSLALVEEALEIYDETRHRGLALRYAHDPRVAATNYKAWNLWHLGRPRAAQAMAEEAHRWARVTGHANTIGLSLCYGIALTNIWLGDARRVEEAARAALALAREKSLALWDAWGRIHLGWALFQADGRSGFEELTSGLDAARRIGARRLEAFHLGLAADMQSRAGRHVEAARTFADAFAALDRDRDLPFAPDLHRLRALALLRGDAGAAAAAERDLLEAAEIARGQEALSLEHRAVRDLARLEAGTGAGRRAEERLAALRARFPEGEDPADAPSEEEALPRAPG